MQTNTAPSLLINRRDACTTLSISLRTLETLISSKALGCIRIGKSVRLEPEELERFKASRRINASL